MKNVDFVKEFNNFTNTNSKISKSLMIKIFYELPETQNF
jgi:hypothetical protein